MTGGIAAAEAAEPVEAGDLVAARRARLEIAVRRWGWQTIASLTSLVIAFAAIRGIARGYEPVGDNALIALRSRDVFTGDHPFIGAWSSATLGAGIDVNHPGPLLYDVLALPARLLGVSVGVPVAVATLQIVVVWTVGFVAVRAGGATGAIVATSFTALLVWTLGSELLYDPWQPNVMVLPFWLLLCTLWAVAVGRIALLPLAAGVGSFAMQTHLSYVALVPVALLGALGLAAFDRRGDGRIDELRRPIGTSAAVILVLWAQPLWEQVAGPGRGNLGRMLTVATGGGDDPDVTQVETVAPGLSLATRVVGSVFAVPPFWGRSGYDSTVVGGWLSTDDGGRELVTPALASLGASLVGLVVLGALVATAVHGARRAAATHVVRGFVVLAPVLVIAVLTVVVTPIDALGLSPHKVRWLWVLAAFLTMMLVLAGLAVLRADRRSIGLSAVVALGAVALIATLPTFRQTAGPASQDEVWDNVSVLREQLEERLASADVGPVFFDPSTLGFGEPYSAPVLAEFLEHGVDLVVDEHSLVRQLGPGRDLARADDTPRRVLTVRTGPDSVTVPPDEERLAFASEPPAGIPDDEVVFWSVGVFLRVPEVVDR